MPELCDHHAHVVDAEDGYVWRCTDRHGIVIGSFCPEHLGDGLDGFDGDVRMERVG